MSVLNFNVLLSHIGRFRVLAHGTGVWMPGLPGEKCTAQKTQVWSVLCMRICIFRCVKFLLTSVMSKYTVLWLFTQGVNVIYAGSHTKYWPVRVRVPKKKKTWLSHILATLFELQRELEVGVHAAVAERIKLLVAFVWQYLSHNPFKWMGPRHNHMQCTHLQCSGTAM